MDEELFTDSEKDWPSTFKSDWMNKVGRQKGKPGGKRKMNQQNSSKKKKARSKNSRLSDSKTTSRLLPAVLAGVVPNFDPLPDYDSPSFDLKKMSAESVVKQTKPEWELKVNCSETDFNEDDRRVIKEKRQRSFKQSNNKTPFSHQISSSNKQSKIKNDTEVDLTDVFQEVRNKKQLAVRCGKTTGCLYKLKYENGEKCILCKGRWFSLGQFEELGGKGHHKKWKSSVYYKSSNGLQVRLQKLIKNGCLSEFGQLKESIRQVTQKDKDGASSVQNVTTRSEFINLKGFPESWKRLFSKTVEIPVCGIEKKTIQPDTESSSDESASVAERVKMNRRESVILAQAISKKITEPVESTASARDSSEPPNDATEPAVSPVVEEPGQTTGVDTAAQLNFSDSPAEWQNPVASEETEKTGQMQLFEFLANQFNTINNTLKSIDSSLKKLVEKQSENTLPQYISITPAVIKNPQIYSSVKEEQITEVLNQ